EGVLLLFFLPIALPALVLVPVRGVNRAALKAGFVGFLAIRVRHGVAPVARLYGRVSRRLVLRVVLRRCRESSRARGLVAASYAAQQMPGALGVQSDRPATHDASERRSG